MSDYIIEYESVYGFPRVVPTSDSADKRKIIVDLRNRFNGEEVIHVDNTSFMIGTRHPVGEYHTIEELCDDALTRTAQRLGIPKVELVKIQCQITRLKRQQMRSLKTLLS